MCKPKNDLRPFVWGKTDYVAYRFDYYSIGDAFDQIATEMQSVISEASFSKHKLNRCDLDVIDLDTMAFNLKLSLDEVNNEIVFHFRHIAAAEKVEYEVYIGRFFTQLIFRKLDATVELNFDKFRSLLDCLLHLKSLNLVRMTCIVHSIMEDTIDNMSRIVEENVISELKNNNLSYSTYADSRDVDDIQLESKRVMNLQEEKKILKLEMTGLGYYKTITEQNFLNSYNPLFDVVLLENTRYFRNDT